MREVRRVIDHGRRASTPFGIHVLVDQHHTMFIADTTVNERPTAEECSPTSPSSTAQVARRMGHEPRVAFLSYSTFGNPQGRVARQYPRGGVGPRRARNPGFEYEGEMAPDVALNPRQVMRNYPFCRLSGPCQRP
jgi:malate dehydrogenase (oxaloacetate-decarboxylating)(NADP+)